jgi:hypothetical protein
MIATAEISILFKTERPMRTYVLLRRMLSRVVPHAWGWRTTMNNPTEQWLSLVFFCCSALYLPQISRRRGMFCAARMVTAVDVNDARTESSVHTRVHLMRLFMICMGLASSACHITYQLPPLQNNKISTPLWCHCMPLLCRSLG